MFTGDDSINTFLIHDDTINQKANHMAYEDKSFLSIDRKKEIQSQISHALVRYRKEKGLTQKEMAERVGYSLPRYRDFEKGLELNNQLLKAFDSISLWAHALEIDPTDFCTYVMAGSGTLAKKGKLLRWQEELFEALRRVRQDVRREWSQSVASQKRRDRLETALEDMGRILSLPKAKHDVVSQLIRVLSQEI